MDVFIYTFGHDLPCERYDIEEAMEYVIAGWGEETGAGGGEMGCNVDLEIDTSLISPQDAFERIMIALRDLKLPESTLVVVNGDKYNLTYADPLPVIHLKEESNG